MPDTTEPVKVPVRTTTYLSKELRQAYIDKDGPALAKFTKNAEDDHETLTRGMFDSQLSPWNRTTLDNGKVVHFHQSKDGKSYVWSTVVAGEGDEPTTDIEHAANLPAGVEIKAKSTVQVGFYSASGGQASSFLVDLPRLASDTAIALVVGSLVYNGLGSFIQGLTPAYHEWIDAAQRLQKAREAMVGTEGVQYMTAKQAFVEAEAAAEVAMEKAALETSTKGAFTNFLKRWPRFGAGVGALAVTVIVTYLFDKYVLPHIVQDFFIKINIVNLDKQSWKIDEWYHDNGIIAGGKDFELVTLGPPSGEKVPFSDKFADLVGADTVTYTIQNSFTLMDGVGAALRVVDPSQGSDPKTGFAIGYDCPYAKDNWMTVKPGVPSSLKDWYWDKSNWPERPQPLGVNSTLDRNGEKVNLVAVTDALSGKSDHLYHCWVTIGSLA